LEVEGTFQKMSGARHPGTENVYTLHDITRKLTFPKNFENKKGDNAKRDDESMDEKRKQSVLLKEASDFDETSMDKSVQKARSFPQFQMYRNWEKRGNEPSRRKQWHEIRN
jgi:hypothetical protein